MSAWECLGAWLLLGLVIAVVELLRAPWREDW